MLVCYLHPPNLLSSAVFVKRVYTKHLYGSGAVAAEVHEGAVLCLYGGAESVSCVQHVSKIC